MELEKLFDKIPYERIYPLPAWQRFAGIFGVVALVVGAFYFFVIQGKDQEIDALQENLAKIQKEVEDNRLHAQKLGKLKEKIAKLETDMKEASKQLPSKKEIPQLLEQVSNIGTQFGLEFLTFKPRPEVRKDFYSEVPVSLKISGKFHNMLMFFDEISHLPRIVAIDDIKIHSDKGSSRLTLQCVATTYRFIEGSEKKKDGKKGVRPSLPGNAGVNAG